MLHGINEPLDEHPKRLSVDLRKTTRPDHRFKLVEERAKLAGRRVLVAVVERLFRSVELRDQRVGVAVTQLPVFGQPLHQCDRIREALDAGKYVAASSHAIVGRTQDGKGVSAGESMSKGLAGGHAYAVLDMFDNGDMRAITLRNPWGEYIREYDPQEGDGRLRPRGNWDEGTSDVELSDFNKRFRRLSIN